jgi:hypothetical protein
MRRKTFVKAACSSSRAWGEKETVGLSKIGRTDKEVEIWEEVYNAHEMNEPRLLPLVEKSLQQARRDRAALDETLEENVRVGQVVLHLNNHSH